VSDGTAGGTRLLLDVNPDAAGSGFYFGANFTLPALGAFVPAGDGLLVFAADDGVHGQELWVTDGSAGGTRLLADLVPGAEASFPGLFTPLGGGLVMFGTNDAAIGTRHWITDGTAAGTRAAPQFDADTPFIGTGDFVPLGNGRVLFTAGSALRIAGVEDAASDVVVTFPESGFNAALGYLTPIGDGQAVFRADDGVHGIEPWITDGTPAGTRLLADINEAEGSFAAGFVALGDGRALFSAIDATHGRELWITDGSGATLVADINPGAGGNALLALVPIGGGRVVFAADDGAHGLEPWVSDGTAAGTMMLADIDPRAVQAGGPGFPGSGSSFPGPFTALGDGRALFSAFSPELGQELWVTDGTPEGTSVVRDILPGGGSASPAGIAAIGAGLAAFTANDGTTGAEPWITDGTAAGTFALADINPGPPGSDALGFARPPADELMG
jgi:ELWxxDGT repeat protein